VYYYVVVIIKWQISFAGNVFTENRRKTTETRMVVITAHIHDNRPQISIHLLMNNNKYTWLYSVQVKEAISFPHPKWYPSSKVSPSMIIWDIMQ